MGKKWPEGSQYFTFARERRRWILKVTGSGRSCSQSEASVPPNRTILRREYSWGRWACAHAQAMILHLCFLGDQRTPMTAYSDNLWPHCEATDLAHAWWVTRKRTGQSFLLSGCHSLLSCPCCPSCFLVVITLLVKGDVTPLKGDLRP